jgi:PAS domain S-box-containing protein
MQRTINAFLSVLLGTIIICVICMLNLHITGHAINAHAFILPAILGAILGFFIFSWNERDRLNRDKRIHLNGVLQSIRNINQILTHERETVVLIQEICDTLVENRGFHSVWIALIDQNGQWGTFAQAGLGDDFKSITDNFKQGESIACCRRVMAQPEVVITDVPLTLCGNCPLVSGYQDRGAISAKLTCNGKTYGMITLSVPLSMVCDPEESRLVKELSEDIAFGLHAIELDEKRKDSEESFRTLVENSLTGISIVQGNEVVYQNKEQERLLGPLPRSSIMGEYENIHPDDVLKVKQFSKKIIEGDLTSMDIDFRYLPEKGLGKPVWINCRATSIVYRKQSSVLFNMVDMTRPKELEKLLITQDKMASLGRVAAGMAHEIRNPLSGINIYLNTLEKFFDLGESQEKVKGVFHSLQSASGKIESVIRRVMDFSKPSQPNFILTDVNAH